MTSKRERDPPGDLNRRRTFYVVYAASGVASLLYEVAWTRLLGLHLGHTTAAASAVLSSYMGGLAAGSLLAGRFAPTWSRRASLAAYAGLEAGIGAWALALPLLLAALGPALRLAYGDGSAGAAFVAGRLAIGLSLVAVPAVAMGATFPLAVRWMVRDPRGGGSEAGRLYAANTLGAVLGAAVGGFVLLPAAGLAFTTRAGIVLNLFAASVALWMAWVERKEEPSSATGTPAVAAARDVSRPPRDSSRSARYAKAARRAAASGTVPRQTALRARPRPGLVAVGLGLSGFVALVHEVAWTRVLALVLGPTSWAFGAMLVAVIGGIAGGSAAGAWLARRTVRPLTWLVVALGVVTGGGGAVTIALNRLPLLVAQAAAAPGATLASVVLTHAGLAALLLLPLTLALGAAFPLGLAAATGGVDRASRDVARVYAANTAGAIAGSLLTGFVLIPRLGLRGTVVFAAAVALAGTLAVSRGALATARSRLAAAGLAVAGFGIVAFGPRWDVELIAAGAYKYAPFVSGLDIETALKAGELLFHADAPSGTVTVKRTAGTTTLAIDGKIDASNGGDMLTQKLLGHLPLLLHDAPRRVCVIGLGSGVTLGAVLRHPVAAVDVIEISPAVVRASEFFRAENHDALRDPRARLIVGDGRTHLELSSGTYDVVISEPSNPWMSGMAALFTREFFGSVRRRLRPGGLFCQWAHTYDMRDDDLRSIVATFVGVFPNATLWLSGESDVLLVGGDAPFEDRVAGIAQRLTRPGVAADLREVEVRDAFSLLSLRTAGAGALRRYGAGAAQQTDDRLALEYTAPRALYEESGKASLEDLARADGGSGLPSEVGAALRRATAAEWRNRGRMLEKADANGLAQESYRQAIERDPRDRDAGDGLVRAAVASGRPDEAAAELRKALAADAGNAAAGLALSKLLAARGDVQQALDVAAEARNVAPGAPEPLEQLASLYADAGDAVRLAPLVREMEGRSPGAAGTLYYAATARFLEGNLQEAVRLATRATAADPGQARAWTVAGAAEASLGQVEAARAAFGKALAFAPRDATARTDLALLELGAGNVDLAARLFAESLTVDPTQEAARAGLADILDRQGHADRATRLRLRTR